MKITVVVFCLTIWVKGYIE